MEKHSNNLLIRGLESKNINFQIEKKVNLIVIVIIKL